MGIATIDLMMTGYGPKLPRFRHLKGKTTPGELCRARALTWEEDFDGSNARQWWQ